MKAFHSVLGALVILASGTASASDSWYMGATVSNYNLDNERAVVDGIDGNALFCEMPGCAAGGHNLESHLDQSL